MPSHRTVGVAMAVAAAVVSLCVWVSWDLFKPDVALETVPGPEAVDLLDHLRGHVTWEEPRGAIIGLSLPQAKETTIRPPSGTQGFVHSVSGPDCKGRIAFIEGIEKRHLLKWIAWTGAEEETIFSRRGDAIWDHVIGQGLALSAARSRVAFISNLEGVQMRDPQRLLQVGTLEIWDLEGKRKCSTNVKGLDFGSRPPFRPLSWFPDGKRLAYVELVPKDKTVFPDAAAREADPTFRRWDKVPAVHILDTDTGEKVFLRVGWCALVSSDGKGILVHDFEDRWSLVDVMTGETKRVTWLGGVHGRAIAFLEGKWVVYWGLPTSGTAVRYTKNNSPIVGKKAMLSLKVAEINSDRFQTIVPYMDPRSAVGFGLGSSE